jgi:hypothetical protein
MDEFLLVNFPEPRQLLINDIVQDWTNIIVRLEAGTYKIGLTGQRNFSPNFQSGPQHPRCSRDLRKLRTGDTWPWELEFSDFSAPRVWQPPPSVPAGLSIALIQSCATRDSRFPVPRTERFSPAGSGQGDTISIRLFGQESAS